MPGTVLTAVMASAPASTTAAAMRAMSGTLGASLTLIGIVTARRTASVTAAALLRRTGEGRAELVADIGAGDVHLDQVGLGSSHDGRHLAEFLHGAGEDAGDQRHAQRLQGALGFRR